MGFHLYSFCTSCFIFALIFNLHLNYIAFTLNSRTIMAPKLRVEHLIQRQRQERVRIQSYLTMFCQMLIEIHQTQHIPSSWQTQLPRGLPALQNWCYANTIFQALLHAPKFVNWLEQEHQSCIIEDCLTCALRGLSLNYWKYPFDSSSIDISHRDLRRSLRRSPSKSSSSVAKRGF